MMFRLLAAAAAMLCAAGSVEAQVLMHRDVSLKMALAIAETALEECGGTASVVVVDRAGRKPGLVERSPRSLRMSRPRLYPGDLDQSADPRLRRLDFPRRLQGVVTDVSRDEDAGMLSTFSFAAYVHLPLAIASFDVQFVAP